MQAFFAHLDYAYQRSSKASPLNVPRQGFLIYIYMAWDILPQREVFA